MYRIHMLKNMQNPHSDTSASTLFAPAVFRTQPPNKIRKLFTWAYNVGGYTGLPKLRFFYSSDVIILIITDAADARVRVHS